MKLLKSIIFVFTLIALFVIVNSTLDSYLYAVINIEGEEEKLNFIFSDDVGNYSLYLPAGITEFEIEKSSNIIIYNENGNTEERTRFSSEDKLIIRDKGNDTWYKLKIHITDSIKTLFIKTASGSLEKLYMDKESWERFSANYVDENNHYIFKMENGKMSGRGNSSWLFNKKSFVLDFDKKKDILDCGEANKWLLISNYLDDSHLRNKVIYDFADKIGLDYVSNTDYVNVYFNGNYYGLYLLSEKVEVEDNRVEISNLENDTQQVNTINLEKYEAFHEETDFYLKKGYAISNNPADITGGYLIEFEVPWEFTNSLSGFRTKNNQYVALSHPEYASVEQVNYIYNYYCELESYLYGSDALFDDIYNLIDLDSFVKTFLIEEIFFDTDSGKTSQFFYKEKDINGIVGKLFSGPIWDFDSSLGNAEITEEEVNSFYTAFHYINNSTDIKSIFAILYQRSEIFRTEIKKMYANIANQIDEVRSEILEISKKIESSAINDTIRWKSGELNGEDYAKYRYWQSVDELLEFYNERTAFLDSAWIDGVNYKTAVFIIYDEYLRYIHVTVKEGELIAKYLPEIKPTAKQFNYWMDTTTGDIIDDFYKLTKDSTFIGVYYD